MSATEVAVFERQPIVLDGDGENLEYLKELAGEAEEVLGYKTPKETLEKISFRQALHEAGVQPFSRESVKNYKEEMHKKYSGNFSVRNGELLTAMMCLSFLAIPASVGFVVGGYSWGFIHPLSLSMAEITGGILFIFSTFICVSVCCLLESGGIKRKGEWRRIPISEYGREIPTFATSTAIEIKKRLPHCGILIEEYYQETVKDPFLVISDGKENGEKYYVEVWEEPGFNMARLH